MTKVRFYCKGSDEPPVSETVGLGNGTKVDADGTDSLNTAWRLSN